MKCLAGRRSWIDTKNVSVALRRLDYVDSTCTIQTEVDMHFLTGTLLHLMPDKMAGAYLQMRLGQKGATRPICSNSSYHTIQ